MMLQLPEGRFLETNILTTSLKLVHSTLSLTRCLTLIFNRTAAVLFCVKGHFSFMWPQQQRVLTYDLLVLCSSPTSG